MSRRATALVAIGLAAVTGGCTLAPRYHTPAVAVPAGFGDPGPWQSAAPGDALPRGSWWQRYSDPILDGPEVVVPSIFTGTAVGIGVAATLVLGIVPEPVLSLANHAANQLFVH